MQCFDGPLLVEVLGAIGMLGGKTVSEEAWQAVKTLAIRRNFVDATAARRPRLV
jgi:hypothetical protein